MTEQFHARLNKLLKSFDLKQAEKLTSEIHRAEMEGYEVSLVENVLWERLTDRLLTEYDKKNSELSGKNK